MSRRKQKFPFHITADEDTNNHIDLINKSEINDTSNSCVYEEVFADSFLSESSSPAARLSPIACLKTMTEENVNSICERVQSSEPLPENINTESSEFREPSTMISITPPENNLVVDERETASPVLRIVTSPVPNGDSDVHHNTEDEEEIERKSLCKSTESLHPRKSSPVRNTSNLSTSSNNGIHSKFQCISVEDHLEDCALTESNTVYVLPSIENIASNSPNSVIIREMPMSSFVQMETKMIPNEGDKLLLKKSDSLICPVCKEQFKSKRSFNAHILVHCQLDKSPTFMKRSAEDPPSSFPLEKRKAFTHTSPNCSISDSVSSSDCEMDSSLPLDLSFRRSPNSKNKYSSISKGECLDSNVRNTPSINFSLNERYSLEDENDNLVNEGKEHEKAFFDHSQNEIYLTEDSSGLEPPLPLPLFHTGGVSKNIKVCSDEGSPMVYRIKIHAEQIFVSRILAVNEETGDKMELFKCFMCSLSFPSVSRLQAHLSHHRQRFVCRKCNYSCDSRVQFSHHVQREHQIKDRKKEGRHIRNESTDESSSAENTVTVAALLSALRDKSVENSNTSSINESKKIAVPIEEEDEEIGTCPVSPENQEIADPAESNTGADLFKIYTCRYCNKKFDRAFSCNRHERVHTGYKPCFCRICGRGFSEPRNLRHHVIRFHSDGSLRHLIKRDRRKRKEDESPPSLSPVPSMKDILKDNGNKVSGQEVPISRIPLDFQRSPSNINLKNNANWHNLKTSFHESGLSSSNEEDINNYTTNLTKMFAASLDSTSQSRKNLSYSINQKSLLSENKLNPKGIDADAFDVLEPGEIRLNMASKIIEDEGGRRLIISDEQSDNCLDHSPQFSSYAPRLNIIQEPINRDKALRPITDDIGRTFYECPYCHKLFGSTSDLNRHLDFHEDLRPYNCEYCDYSARTNSQLKVHKMRHEGIKQFSCEICNYNGVTQSDLNRHKKTQSHISRSQNICSFCGLGFYSSAQKQVHIVQCHPEVEGASSLLQMSMGAPAGGAVTTLVPKVEEGLPLTVSSSPASSIGASYDTALVYTCTTLPMGYVTVPTSSCQ